MWFVLFLVWSFVCFFFLNLFIAFLGHSTVVSVLINNCYSYHLSICVVISQLKWFNGSCISYSDFLYQPVLFRQENFQFVRPLTYRSVSGTFLVHVFTNYYIITYLISTTFNRHLVLPRDTYLQKQHKALFFTTLDCVRHLKNTRYQFRAFAVPVLPYFLRYYFFLTI